MHLIFTEEFRKLWSAVRDFLYASTNHGRQAKEVWLGVDNLNVLRRNKACLASQIEQAGGEISEGFRKGIICEGSIFSDDLVLRFLPHPGIEIK